MEEDSDKAGLLYKKYERSGSGKEKVMMTTIFANNFDNRIASDKALLINKNEQGLGFVCIYKIGGYADLLYDIEGCGGI